MTTEKRHEYTELLRQRLSAERFRHSLCVAEQSVKLAGRFGADPERAELAGLLHDIMKEAGRDEQLVWMRREIHRSDPVMLSARKLLHAPAAAAYCRSELGIRDREVLGAIRYHTTARAGMTPLERVLYLADFTSADRDYNDVGVMRRLVDKDADEAMVYALAYTIRDLAVANKPIHPDTLSAYNEIVTSGGNNTK